MAKKKKSGIVRKTIDTMAGLTPLGVTGKATLAAYDYLKDAHDDVRTKRNKEKSIRVAKHAKRKLKKKAEKAKQKRKDEHLRTLREWESEENDVTSRIAEYKPSTNQKLREDLKIYEEEQHQKDLRNPNKKLKDKDKDKDKDYDGPTPAGPGGKRNAAGETVFYQKGGLTPTYDARGRSKKEHI